MEASVSLCRQLEGGAMQEADEARRAATVYGEDVSKPR